MQLTQGEAFEKTLKRRLCFEEMLSDISARFMATPFDQVDSEIHNALGQILEFFQVDRCALLEFQEDKAFARVTHAVNGKGVEPVSGDINLAEMFPWCYEQLMQGGHINLSRVEDYPEDALIDRQSHAEMGIKSALNIPMSLGHRISRAIVINHTRRHQAWPEEYIPRLRLLGEIIVNALERRQDRLQLEEQFRFEKLLAEISGRFVNLNADRIDSEIEDAQRRICELLDLDRSSLWQVPEREPGTLLLTHIHQPPGSLPPPERMNARDFFPWTTQKVLDGETLIISKMIDLPPEADRDRENYRAYGAKSNVSVPLSVAQNPVFGVLTFAAMRQERSWPETVAMGFKLIAQVFANALIRRHMENQLQERMQEIEFLKEKLEKEIVFLREETMLFFGHDEIVGNSNAIREVLAQAEKVASTDSTVLILGETGTGKELIARAIHNMSSRKDRLLVTVNCASMPPTLIESELFGREKGAYTGALTRMTGRFEVADGSTLFLDEIGDMPLDLQSKLLRVLEQGRFERLGSSRTIKVNVRLIAATNRDLAKDVNEGRFRKDLFYRLNVFPITVPPLRDRIEDIPPLVWAFVKQFGKSLGKRIESIPKKNMEDLMHYSWPGNIRELRNVIEHSMILSQGKSLNVKPPACVPQEQSGSYTLEDMERRHILEVLERTGWRMSGKKSASEILGMKRTSLYSKMKALGIMRSSS